MNVMDGIERASTAPSDGIRIACEAESIAEESDFQRDRVTDLPRSFEIPSGDSPAAALSIANAPADGVTVPSGTTRPRDLFDAIRVQPFQPALFVEQSRGDFELAPRRQHHGLLLRDFLLESGRGMGRLILPYLEQVEVVLERRQRAAVRLGPLGGLIAGLDRIRRRHSNVAFVTVTLTAKSRQCGFGDVELLTPEVGETLERR